MALAFKEAQEAFTRGEVPVGAVITLNGAIIAKDGNRTIERKDPTAHAEVLVIRAAAQFICAERLDGCDLYVTLEPCPMCTGAISAARIRRLYYGARNFRSGAVDSVYSLLTRPPCSHTPEVYDGLMAEVSADLLRRFFMGLRDE